MNKFLVKNPLVTEKGTVLSSLGKYLFLVDDKANKSEIKKIIESNYKVKITSVNIINNKPKKRRLRQNIGIRSGYKKALITLQKGQSLDIIPR